MSTKTVHEHRKDTFEKIAKFELGELDFLRKVGEGTYLF